MSRLAVCLQLTTRFPQANSATNYHNDDERKERRRAANRTAAKKCRDRKRMAYEKLEAVSANY